MPPAQFTLVLLGLMPMVLMPMVLMLIGVWQQSQVASAFNRCGQLPLVAGFGASYAAWYDLA
jgi:Zn-dependent membrane protease YugP